mmetsp:Transcript_21978/g.63369  ORF Transcript_21978/g.63369 Transcript_21978/m.63369 type:complete len:319 (-) Transcript_21978:33-989(-)
MQTTNAGCQSAGGRSFCSTTCIPGPTEMCTATCLTSSSKAAGFSCQPATCGPGPPFAAAPAEGCQSADSPRDPLPCTSSSSPMARARWSKETWQDSWQTPPELWSPGRTTCRVRWLAMCTPVPWTTRAMSRRHSAQPSSAFAGTSTAPAGSCRRPPGSSGSSLWRRKAGDRAICRTRRPDEGALRLAPRDEELLPRLEVPDQPLCEARAEVASEKGDACGEFPVRSFGEKASFRMLRPALAALRPAVATLWALSLTLPEGFTGASGSSDGRLWHRRSCLFAAPLYNAARGRVGGFFRGLSSGQTAHSGICGAPSHKAG